MSYSRHAWATTTGWYRPSRRVRRLATLDTARQQPALADDPLLDEIDGDVGMMQGRYDRSIARYERAIVTAAQRHAPLLGAELQARAGFAHARVGNLDRAITLGESALKVFATTDQLQSRASVLGFIGAAQADAGELAQARNAWTEAAALTATLDAPAAHMSNAVASAVLAAELGDQAGSKRTMDEVATWEPRALTDDLIGLHIGRARIAFWQGDVGLARREFALSTVNLPSNPSGMKGLTSQLEFGLALVASDEDRLDEGARGIYAAIEKATQAQQANHTAYLRLELAAIELERGKLDAAQNAASAALAEYERERLPVAFQALAHARLAEIALAAKDLPTARTERQRALERDVDVNVPWIHVIVRRVSAEVRAASGNPDEVDAAKRELAAVIDNATKLGFRGLALEARIALGRVEGTAGSATLDAAAKDANALGQLRLERRARARR